MSDDTAAQPSVEAAYTAPGNPATQAPSEQAAASNIEAGRGGGNDGAKAVRNPPDPNKSYDDDERGGPVPPPLMKGRGGEPVRGEEVHGATVEDTDRRAELDGEQMRAPGEGEVARAVKKNPGGGRPA